MEVNDIMDRVSFFNNITGITYPEMLVDFFDHFVALKQLLNSNNCSVNIIKIYENSGIEFDVIFKSPEYMNRSLNDIYAHGNAIVIYNRTMTIHIEVLTENEFKIKLY